MTTPQDLAAQIEALEKTEAWLRECSDWLLSNDLDMQCPMQTDPLDLADALPAIVAAIRQGEGAGDRISREETASTIERTTIADGASASAMLVFLAAAIRDDRVTPSISPAPDERFSFGRCKDCPGDHSRMCCKTQTSAGSSVPSDQALQVLQAEEYRNMHSIATEDLGYPSILEALEATPHAEQLGEEIGYISAPDERDDEVRKLRDVLKGLELTEDSYSLRIPYDGDADDQGRSIVVGGDVVLTFTDSDQGEELREALMALQAAS